MSRQKVERLLRLPGGHYATPDGRFYIDKHRDGWWVIDAGRRKSVEQVAVTLAKARAWITARRKVRP